MANTESHAARWAHFIASRPEFPAGERFLAAFKAGRITRLCDCGCNSFEIEVPENSLVPLLAEPGNYGPVFQLEFRTDEEHGSLTFMVYAKANGHLASLDVEYCGNSFPVPDEPLLVEPPYHVRIAEALLT